MRILYIVSTLEQTGPTSQLLNIIRNLGDDYTPLVVTLSSEPMNSRLENFRGSGIKVIQLNMSRLKGLFMLKNRITSLVEEFKPDIVHSQGVRGDSLSTHFAKDIPVVCTVRNYPQIDYAMTYGVVLGKIMSRVHMFKLSKASFVVGVSGSVSENLHGFGLSNVQTIFNGVETKRYIQILDNKKNKLKEKIGLHDDSFVFISSGSLCERKNPTVIINAFIEAFDKYSNVELVFIGDGSLLHECKQLAVTDTRINFFGNVENVEDFLQASDMFVSSSIAEGFPNSVLEAMACGLPVILSDIDPHKEFFTISRDIGDMFAVQDVKELSKLFEQVKYLNLEKSRSAVQEVIRTKLSAKAMSSQYQELYKALINS